MRQAKHAAKRNDGVHKSRNNGSPRRFFHQGLTAAVADLIMMPLRVLIAGYGQMKYLLRFSEKMLS